MEKLIFNPSNKKYYSEEFVKGFECGVERQFNADMAEKTAEWIFYMADKDGNDGMEEKWCKCSKCGELICCEANYCPDCGAKIE